MNTQIYEFENNKKKYFIHLCSISIALHYNHNETSINIFISFKYIKTNVYALKNHFLLIQFKK